MKNQESLMSRNGRVLHFELRFNHLKSIKLSFDLLESCSTFLQCECSDTR